MDMVHSVFGCGAVSAAGAGYIGSGAERRVVRIGSCPKRNGWQGSPLGGDRVVGVRLEDGTEHRADIVVCAADGHRAIFDWLGGKYVDDEIRDLLGSF